MTDDLQRQSGDPNGSSDVTSPDSADPLGSNAEEWKVKANNVYEEYQSSCPAVVSLVIDYFFGFISLKEKKTLQALFLI